LQEQQGNGKTRPPSTIYFYCDYRDVQTRTPAGVYGSLLAQMVETHSPDRMPFELEDAFETNRNPPNDSFLQRQLLKVASQTAPARTRIVIDGLDECTPEARVEILETLMELNRSAAEISLLLTSRDEVDIRAVLAKVPKLRIDSSVNSEDITSFVVDECERNNKLKRKLKGSTKQEVIQTISSQADGMYVISSEDHPSLVVAYTRK